MKIVLFAIFLMAPALALAAKPGPADYTVAIHVQSSQVIYECWSDVKGSNCGWSPRLTVLIDGKKYEIEDERSRKALLRVGDYKARIVKDNTTNPYEYWRTYELLLSDGTTRKYDVVGETE